MNHPQQQESMTTSEQIEELKNKVAQEYYVNMDRLAGEEALEELLAQERQRVIELVEKQKKGQFRWDGMYTMACDDIISALKERKEEQT